MRHLLTATLVVLIALAAGLTIAPAQSARTTADLPMSEVMNREIIVELDTARGAKSVSAFLSANELELARTRDLSYATYQVVRVPEGQDYYTALARLEADPQVRTVGPNVRKRVSDTVLNDPLLLNTADTVEEGLTAPHATNDQYALLQTGTPHAWDVTTGDPRVVVAILDTGVNFNHEDLQGRFWTNTDEIPNNDTDDDSNGYVDDYHGYDFQFISSTGGDSDPTDESGDYISHGNATTSIVAAIGNNNKGIAGVAGGNSASGGVRVMMLRVGTNTDIGVDAEIAAIDYAINNGAKIISMSFGGVSGGPPEENAIDRAWDAGLVICAASGNVGNGNKSGDEWLIDLPAGFPNCIAVGATTIFPSQTVNSSSPVIDEVVANYSKTGPETELVAPGTHILCAAHDDHAYSNLAHQFTGTSAATPLVAGYAALIWSKDIAADGVFNMSNADVRNHMKQYAEDLGPSGFDQEYGYGRINISSVNDLPSNALKGDANGDEVIDEADLTIIVSLDGVTSADANYDWSADYNDDHTINNADAIAVIGVIGGAANGDTNADGTVDENDVQELIDRFGAKAGDANYTVAADANRDGIIDELDLFVVGRQFGA